MNDTWIGIIIVLVAGSFISGIPQYFAYKLWKKWKERKK